MMAAVIMENLHGDKIQRSGTRRWEGDGERREALRDKGKGVKRSGGREGGDAGVMRRRMKRKRKRWSGGTYKWRVGQSHDPSRHFSDEYDEDDGEELQGGKKKKKKRENYGKNNKNLSLVLKFSKARIIFNNSSKNLKHSPVAAS